MHIRQSWMNSILHATASIHKRKEELMTMHAGKAFFSVFLLIFAEIYLGIISLPMYLVAAPVSSKDPEAIQYRFRRKMTMSFLVAILVIWLIKLITILILSWYSGVQGDYSIRQIDTKTRELNTVIHEIVVAQVSPSIPAPKITNVTQKSDGSLAVEGTSRPHDIVAIHFVHKDKPETGVDRYKIYANEADEKGLWTIGENRSVFALTKDNYIATALAYDRTAHLKSLPSSAVSFDVQDITWKLWLTRIDTIVNVVMSMLVVVGVGLLVIMI